jgi:hypothetical protein
VGNLLGAAVSGSVFPGSTWAWKGDAGSRTRDAAANVSQECGNLSLDFIIQGIPCLLSHPRKHKPHAGGLKVGAGSRWEQLCLL